MSLTAPSERIRILRELNGWTQADLADASGISQSLISSIENLRRDATDDVVQAIATATGTPLSFFNIVNGSPADSLHFRKNKTASAKLTKQVSAFFGEAQRVSATLLEYFSYPIRDMPIADSRTGDLTQGSIEEYALLARSWLRLDADTPILNVTRALERVGVAVFHFALPGAEEGQVVGKGHFGVSSWEGHSTRAVIGIFSGAGDRDRFTIGHELGHLILHTFRNSTDSEEIEAHRFAGALLLPMNRAQELMNQGTTLDQYARVKATFGISIQACIMRASTLGLISEDRKKSLMIQLSQRGWRRSEPVPVANENPLLLGKALASRWPKQPYLSAAEALAIQPQVLRSIAPVPGASHSIGKDSSSRIYSFRRSNREDPTERITRERED